MPRWSGVLGETTGLADLEIDPADISSRRYPRSVGERRIASAIRAAGRHLPYNPRCLDEASAGQIMLRRRRHPGVVVIGLARTGEPGKQRKAHAWLVGSTGAVTGGAAARDYAPASCFIPRSIRRTT